MNAIQTLPQIKLVSLLLLLISSATAHSQTEISGQVSGEWNLSGSPYLITNDAVVGADATLVIAPGVTVQFRDSDDDLVVDGTLIAVGTAAAPIRFTSDEAAKSAGQWGEILIRNSGAGTQMHHCTVEYGGGFRSAQLQFAGGAPELINSRVQFSRASGLAIVGGQATISGNTFHENGGFAVTATVDSFPAIQGSQATGNDANSIGRPGGTLMLSGTWTRDDIPYTITNDITVEESAVLTIASGTTVQFQDRDDDLTVDGSLQAIGTAAQPITFTSDAVVKEPGQWGALTLRAGASASRLDHVRVEYGGGFRDEQLRIQDASPTLTQVTVHASRNAGIGIAGGAPRIQNATFTENAGYAATATVTAFPQLIGLSAEGNGGNSVGRSGGTVAATGTWTQPGIPYTIINDITLAEAATLTIAPGTTVQFQDTDDDLTIDGTLLAIGEATAPITFTTNEAEPEPGQWGSVTIRNQATDSLLRHIIVEYGGQFRDEQFRIQDASPTLEQVTFRQSRAAGLGISGGQPVIRDCHFAENLGFAATATVSAFPTLTDLSAVDNGSDAIGRSGGSITQSGTWPFPGIPYKITNDITVQSGITLTIAPATIVQFQDSDDDLTIDGVLRARGTEANPIRFTSDAVEPGPGQWGEILLRNQGEQDRSDLSHCIVEYGGGFRASMLTCDAAHPVITSTTIQFARDHGMGLSEASPLISNSAFRNNTSYAMALDVASFPELTQNTATENGSNSFGVAGGSMMATGTWQAVSVPFTIMNDVTVEEMASLTLAPGSTIQFQDGDDDLWIDGTLVARGTPGQRILFTSDAADKAPNQWGAVVIRDSANDAATVIEHATIEYGGGFKNGMLLITESSPTIRQTRFTGGRTRGLLLEQASPRIEQCHFSENGDYAIAMDPNSFPTNQNNTAELNGADSIAVLGGSLTGTGTWLRDGLPYTITTDVTVEPTGSLTIRPGIIVRFQDSDDDLHVEGTLIAAGTSTAKIRFTTDEAEPAPGQWGGLRFLASSNDSLNRLESVIVEYGGRFRSGAIEVTESAPALSAIEVRNNLSHGLTIVGASPAVNDFIFENNGGAAIRTNDGARPQIRNTSFLNNEGGGVRNDDTDVIVDATLNYWGDDSGPLDTRDDDGLGQTNPDSMGDTVTEYVRWSPPLSTSPTPPVVEQPEFAVDTTLINFGEVGLDQPSSRTVRVENLGNATLTLDPIVIVPDTFTLDTTGPITLEPGQSITLTVSVRTQQAGALSGTLSIGSNDPNQPTIVIDLSANGTTPTEPGEPNVGARITFHPTNETTPAWHPADNRIAFATDRTAGGFANIGMVQANGTSERLIATGPDLGFGIAPFGLSWVGSSDLLMTTESVVFHEYMSFDTTQAPFTRETGDGDDNAFVRRLLVDGGGGGELFQVSRDGTTALWRFSSTGGRGNISLRTAPFADLTGQSARTLGRVHIETRLPANSARHINGAGLTSDGSQFVVALRSNEAYDLYLYDNVGNQAPTRLTTSGQESGVSHGAPTISPDNLWVAYARAERNQPSELYRLNLITGETQNLTNTPDLSETNPSWSPDGAHLVYQRFDTEISGALLPGEEPNWNLHILAVDGTPTPPVEPGPTPDLTLVVGADSSISLTWTDPAQRYQLQSTSRLSSPIIWRPVSPIFVANDGSFRFDVAPNESQGYFRLFPTNTSP